MNQYVSIVFMFLGGIVEVIEYCKRKNEVPSNAGLMEKRIKWCTLWIAVVFFICGIFFTLCNQGIFDERMSSILSTLLGISLFSGIIVRMICKKRISM